MIEPLLTEQYLPCNYQEILGIDYKKRLPDSVYRIGIKGKIKIIPMYRGYRLCTNYGDYYIDDATKKIITILEHNPFISDVLNSTNSLIDIERLNYYDLLSINSSIIPEIEYLSVSKETKDLYSEKEYGWFSYFPIKIELDLSYLCNMHCIHCSRNASSTKSMENELHYEQFLNIIKEAGAMGVSSISLMGGEPLIYKSFFNICEAAKRSGIKNIFTSSNGWVIDNKIAEKISKHFSSIQLSIHGANPTTHDFIVGKIGAWEQLFIAAENLQNNGVSVNLNFTVMKHNINEIVKMPSVAKNMGAKSLRFLALSNSGRGEKLDSLSNKDKENVGQIINTLVKHENNNNLKIERGGFPCYSQINQYSSFYGCTAGRDQLYINAYGYVSCCEVIDQYIGNISDDSLLNLWHSPKMIELRLPPKCDCDYINYCSGGCLYGKKNAYSK